MILDDFIMLGTTVPEPNSDGRVQVCSAGLSPEYRKLVRIYPLARRNVPKRWGVYRVPVERNPRDSRDESFKVAGDREPGRHERINERFELIKKRVPPTERPGLLAPYVIGSIDEANDLSRRARTSRERFSLAVIHPEYIAVEFEHNPDSPNSPQQALFDAEGEPQSGAKRFPIIPRLRFKDEFREWRLMLRDWGTFELQRKEGADYFREHLAERLHLTNESSLLVGNMNNNRTSWLVISVLNRIRQAPTLFDAVVDTPQQTPDSVRREVHIRDEWRCVRCGSPQGLTVGHATPVNKGGSNDISNLQTLCWSCNAATGDAA